MIIYKNEDGNTLVSMGNSVQGSKDAYYALIFHTKEEAIKVSELVNKITSYDGYKPQRRFTPFPSYYIVDNKGYFLSGYSNGEIIYNSSKDAGSAEQAVEQHHSKLRWELLKKAHDL